MRYTLSLLAIPIAFTACLVGGSNPGGNMPGIKEGGTNLAVGAIAVDTGGRYFISRAGSKLLVGDLELRSMRPLDALPAPYLVSFWRDGGGIYVLSLSHDGTYDFSSDTEELISFDLESEQIVWRKTLERQDVRLDVSSDGARLVVADFDDFTIFDSSTGEALKSVTVEQGIYDLDLVAGGDRVVVTEWTRRDEAMRPTTRVSIYELEDGSSVCEITAPNCSSELVLAPDGTRAFLAPTFCGRDPVSILNLDDCAFERNLPGFGPVALSPSGATAVAFIDRDAEDRTAPQLPEAVVASDQRYHLMFIDVATLEYQTAPLGDVLPRYAFTPDGRSLLIDTDEEVPQPVVLLDLDAKTVRPIAGPKVDMDEYVLTPDAAHAFVVDLGLYDVSLTDAVVQSIPLQFVPVSINITQDGATLLMKDTAESNVYLYEVGSSEVIGRIECGEACS